MFVQNRHRVTNCRELANLSETDRNLILQRRLTASQCADVRTVLSMMPRVTMDVSYEVQGEEDKHHITAGAYVTIVVKLARQPLLDLKNDEERIETPKEEEELAEMAEAEEATAEEAALPVVPAKQRKVWEKPAKKKKGAGNKAKKKAPQKQQQAAAKEPVQSTEKEQDSSKEGDDEKERAKRSKRKENDEEESDDGGISASSSDADEEGEKEAEKKDDDADDDDMDFEDELGKKELLLETKSRVTHPVHAPYFPEEIQEWWWVYLVDRKRKLFLSGPTHVTGLVESEQVELRFPAPPKPGTYVLQVCLRSDCYVDAELYRDIKVNVYEAKEVTSHPQWDFPTDDEEEKSEIEHTDASEYTEGNSSDED